MANRSLTYVLTLSDKLSSPLGKVAMAAHAAAAASTELSEATTRLQGVLGPATMAVLAHAAAGRELAAAMEAAGKATRSMPTMPKGMPGAGGSGGGVPPHVPPPPPPRSPDAPVPIPTAPDPGRRSEAAVLKALQKEFDALRRQQIGTIAGRAAEAEEAVDRVRAEAKAYGLLTEEMEEALKARKRLIEADKEAQQTSLRQRGVDPTRAFGASGTRQTTIGSGVLSGFFDNLFTRMGGPGGDPSKRLEELRESAGKADTALKTLAGALGVVSPAGERAATAAGDLVGSLEVLLTPAGATVGVLAGVGVSLGAMAAGAGAAVLHVAELREEMEDLQRLGAPELIPASTIQGAEDAADAVKAIRPALSAIAGVVAADVAPAMEDLAISATAAALMVARALNDAGGAAVALTDTIGKAIVTYITMPARAALGSLELLYTVAAKAEQTLGLPGDSSDYLKSINEAQAALDGFVDRAGGAVGELGMDLAAGTVDGIRVGLRGATAEARAEATALVGALGKQRAAARDSAGGGSSSAEKLATEVDDSAKALERLRDIAAGAAETAADPIDRLTAKYAALREEIEAAAKAAGGGREAAAAALQAGAAVNAAESVEVRAAYAQLGEEVGKGLTEVIALLQAESMAARAQVALGRAGAAVGALGQGNVVGAIGAATGIPAVAIAGEALGLLAQLGELSEEELRTRGEAFASAVGEGLRVLPGLIISILPDLTVAIVAGTLEALATLPQAIAQAIRDVFSGGAPGSDQRRQTVGGALGGAAAGAATGAVFGGPLGALIGGGVGAIVGASAGKRGSDERSRSTQDLASGFTLPRGGAPSRATPTPVVVSVRGSGVGLRQALDVDAGPWGPMMGRRS